MSLDPITLNGTEIPQPRRIREYRAPQQTDQTAVDGSTQRNRNASARNPNGTKMVAELDFGPITKEEFNVLDGLTITGSGLFYRNPESKYGVLTFSGLPYVEEGEYMPGESLWSESYKLTIREN